MATSPVKVKITGLKEFTGALRQIDSELPAELKVAFKAIAEKVAGEARSKVPRRTGRAAASIKARATAKSAAIAFGGTAAPYYPWLDFGGAVGRNDSVTLPFIPTGRYLYPTVKDNRTFIIQEADKAIARVARSAKFETKGGL